MSKIKGVAKATLPYAIPITVIMIMYSLVYNFGPYASHGFTGMRPAPQEISHDH